MKAKPKPEAKSSDALVLKGGLTLHESAYWLCLDLDLRGWRLERHGVNLRLVQAGGTPPPALTPTDRELIAKWKPELLQIADYLTTEIATA
jgi:hypothetical protein